ncbi:MAG: acetaldehyde dehydrogenase (acetylating), partial [Immundisolibacteraceae bacterium]|nr:acetaldehyde dehydrogenase (acetylating) [Immundisolibacteraceae bacterium]
MDKIKVAILGSGNIGTDLMYKILKRPNNMELCLVAGIDADSDGLSRARDAGIATSADSIEAILESGAQIVF